MVGGGWQRLAVGGWLPLAVSGGWWRLGVGGSWRLAVGGPLGRSLRAVLNKKKCGSLRTALFLGVIFSFCGMCISEFGAGNFLAPILKWRCKTWYKIAELWHDKHGPREGGVVICDGPLIGWLLLIPIVPKSPGKGLCYCTCSQEASGTTRKDQHNPPPPPPSGSWEGRASETPSADGSKNAESTGQG